MLTPDTPSLQGRYSIVRCIGQGGMGAVYLAKDQRLGNSVALKETFFNDDRSRRAFEREARLLASLRHPALPKVIDHFGESDGRFLVMEFIPGEDLGQLLERRGGAFAAEEVLSWGDQLLDALEYLHKQLPPIIHRDIKPQNLKHTPDGQIVLLDFGLAKGTPLEMTSADPGVSTFGYTRYYAPLEQVQGAGTEARSDIYALAATLYHLVTGVTPPDALARAAMLLKGGSDPLRSANKLNPRVPVELGAALAQALAINREDRPASASEFRKTLQEVRRSLKSRTNSGYTTFVEPAATPAGPSVGIRATAQPKNAAFHSATTQRVCVDAALDVTERETPKTSQPLAPTRIVPNSTPAPRGVAGEALQVSSTMDVPLVETAVSRRLWLWYLAGAAVLALILVTVALLFRPHTPSGGQPGPGAEATVGGRSNGSETSISSPVEVIRYSFDLKPNQRSSSRTPGTEPIKPGQSFKLHFTARQNGYLYILAPGKKNIPVTFLTAKPLPESGVVSNMLTGGTDFEFPKGPGNGIGITNDMYTTPFTIIFSTTALTTPIFLTARAGHELTISEQREFEEFRSEHAIQASRLVIERDFDGHSLLKTPENLVMNKPLVFDIPIRQK